MKDDCTRIVDSELIALAKNGESKATSELFERYYQTSLKLARRILPSDADSEDAVQTAYCSVLQHIGSFRGEASFATWVNRIVINQCFMSLRAPWHRRRLMQERGFPSDCLNQFVSTAPSPETLAYRNELAEAIGAALIQLPSNLQLAFTMYSDSDLPIAEVAAKLGLTLAATKTRIHRARKAIRSSLRRISHPSVRTANAHST